MPPKLECALYCLDLRLYLLRLKERGKIPACSAIAQNFAPEIQTYYHFWIYHAPCEKYSQ